MSRPGESPQGSTTKGWASPAASFTGRSSGKHSWRGPQGYRRVSWIRRQSGVTHNAAMARVSLSMIVKNEAESLTDILTDASSFCDELIVVDTGSTDGTQSVAAAAGAKVIDVPWTDNFSAARNASLDACNGDWIVWLDADDRIPVESQKGFTRVLAELGDDVDAVLTPYHLSFDANNRCIGSVKRERILRRAAGLRWSCAIHEFVDTSSVRTREEPELIVEHRPSPRKMATRDSERNLRIIEKMYDLGDRSMRTLYYRATELEANQRYEAAILAYDEMLRSAPPTWERYFALISMAECQITLRRFTEAAESALQAVQINPCRPEAWVVVGMSHYHQEQWMQAIPFFLAATMPRARPIEGPVREYAYGWTPWHFLSLCLGKIGRYAEALHTGQLALNGNPEPEQLRERLAEYATNLPAAF